MDPSGSSDLHTGLVALAAGRWEAARAAFERTVDGVPGDSAVLATALDGLGEAFWWLGRTEDAIDRRTRAYGIEVQNGSPGAAARIAVWLSAEYGNVMTNAPAAAGWLARAERLAADAGTPAALGWVALAHAEREVMPTAQIRWATEALSFSRAGADSDLEILALTRLGLARILEGSPEEGLIHIDEAMAAATGGEAGHLSTIGLACCNLAVATELTGDRNLFGQWSAVVRQRSHQRNLPILTEFCDCCRAEEAADEGDFHGAEYHLKHALAALETAGFRSRCFSPIARLAEMWIRQGRIEEADALLEGSADDDTLVVRAELALAQGETVRCRTLGERAIRKTESGLPMSRALLLVGRAALADGDLDGAFEAHGRLTATASPADTGLPTARAALLLGWIAEAEGDLGTAGGAFESALGLLSDLPGAVERPDAHLGLARTLTPLDRTLAAAEAKMAIAEFEALGATHRVDEASALLRRLGVRSRVGPKNVGVLSKREDEVVRLVAQGLTNAEIAERLFISVKTAGNHVSSILTKLGLRSRAEAAAYAVISLPHSPPS
jgi:DNA-binding CsgD family transcriptional regulator